MKHLNAQIISDSWDRTCVHFLQGWEGHHKWKDLSKKLLFNKNICFSDERAPNWRAEVLAFIKSKIKNLPYFLYGCCLSSWASAPESPGERFCTRTGSSPPWALTDSDGFLCGEDPGPAGSLRPHTLSP